MIVVVDGPSGRISLTEPENLQALHVELRSCDAASAALGDLGRIDGDHAWLIIDRLRALSPLRGDRQWCSGFDGAMAYAQSKGWLNETGTEVRAHLA